MTKRILIIVREKEWNLKSKRVDDRTVEII